MGIYDQSIPADLLADQGRIPEERAARVRAERARTGRVLRSSGTKATRRRTRKPRKAAARAAVEAAAAPVEDPVEELETRAELDEETAGDADG